MGLSAEGLFGAFNIETLKQVKRYTTSNTISYFFMDCLMKPLFLGVHFREHCPMHPMMAGT